MKIPKLLKPWNWSELQTLSKQGVVKSTIIMPVIGYLILFNQRLENELMLSETFVFNASAFNEARLYLLYFGLAAFAAAALWFQAKCPDVIRAHGSAFEFINKEENAVSGFRRDQMLHWVIRHDHSTAIEATGLTVQEAVGLAKRGNPEIAVATHMYPHPPGHAPGGGAWRGSEAIEHAKGLKPDLFDRRTKLISSLREEVERYHQQRPEVMNVYLVRQKGFFPLHRAFVTYLYLLGFVLLAIPTVEVFIRVLIQATKSLSVVVLGDGVT